VGGRLAEHYTKSAEDYTWNTKSGVSSRAGGDGFLVVFFSPVENPVLLTSSGSDLLCVEALCRARFCLASAQKRLVGLCNPRRQSRGERSRDFDPLELALKQVWILQIGFEQHDPLVRSMQDVDLGRSGMVTHVFSGFDAFAICQ
jgi:hypothetical protein